MWIIIFLSTECVKNFPVDEMEDSLWITGESYVDKIVDRGLEKPKCVKSGKLIYTLYMA